MGYPKESTGLSLINYYWLVVDLPLWKIWVHQLGLLFPIYTYKKCSKPPTSHCLWPFHGVCLFLRGTQMWWQPPCASSWNRSGKLEAFGISDFDAKVGLSETAVYSGYWNLRKWWVTHVFSIAMLNCQRVTHRFRGTLKTKANQSKRCKRQTTRSSQMEMLFKLNTAKSRASRFSPLWVSIVMVGIPNSWMVDFRENPK